MICQAVLMLPLLSWSCGLDGKRLDYLANHAEAIETAKDHQDSFYTPMEVTTLHRYFVLSYAKAIGDGVLEPKYCGEFDKIDEYLQAVDWGKLKPTECEKRIAKLTADLKTAETRYEALKAKRVAMTITPEESREQHDLLKSQKSMSDELIKHELKLALMK